MTTLSGSYLIKRGKHRLLEPINDICIATDAIGIALAVHMGQPLPTGGHVVYECKRLPMNVRLPTSGPAAVALSGKMPDVIKLYFHKLPPHKPLGPEGTGGFASTLTSLYCATFVNLYERSKPFLEKHFGSKDVKKWSDFWRFVWVVRNCCAHGGTLAFNDTSASSVVWHSIKYSPISRDFAGPPRLVIGGDLSLGDLLVLMVEMSEELDAIGAPI